MSSPKKPEGLTYQKAGVDPEKAGGILSRFAQFQKARPRDGSLLSGIGPFAALYRLKPLISSYDDPLLVTCCDGVGTKAKLALEWGKLDGLGQDLVAMNVNDLLCTGAKPLLFLDYYACGRLEESQLLTLLESIQIACELAGCSLAGGETAEMPGLYAGDDFDLAGFAVGLVDRSAVLGPEKVQPGDRLLAVQSSGAHSNGYSLIRKVVEKEGIKPSDPAPFGNGTWRDLLLAPTHIYVSALRPLLENVHAMAHITGGGLYENLPRVLPTGTRAVISAAQWPMTDLFIWLGECAEISTQELLKTFNCGVGLILVCQEAFLTQAMRHLESQGLRSWDVGSVESTTPGATPEVHWR